MTRKSLSAQILALLLLALLGILGAWGAFELRRSYAAEHERYINSHHAAVERLAHNLVYPVWNLNRSEVDKTIRYEALDEGVDAILVYDDSNKLYTGLVRNALGQLETYDDREPHHQAVLSKVAFDRQDILKNGQAIGMVAVYVSDEPLQGLWRKQWAGLFLRLLGLIGALGLVLYIALRRVVVQPLTALKDWAATTGPLDRPQRPALRSSEEIDAVADSFTQMTQRLTANQEWYRVLFERSQYALMTLSPPHWRFDSGNPAALSMFGVWDEEDFKDKDPWQLSPLRQPDGQLSEEKAKALIETAMREGSCLFDWTHCRINGEEFPASVLLTRMELDGQAMLQATVRDESEKKKLELSLAQQERLASMGLLAAGVAHEINNPLAYSLIHIESLATQLKQRGLDEEAASAAKALDGMGRIRQITKGLGSFSRTESGERQGVDLKRCLEGAVSLARNEIRFRAQLKVEIAALPVVLASEGKLSQVFLNLLINASHSIEEGPADQNLIELRAWSGEGQALVSIRDTGKGIPPENLARIWEPFFTTKPVGKGTGLGLSICKSIVEEFGGSISVESSVGQGTLFLVRLPSSDQALSPAAPEAAAAPSQRRGRLLVIDDEDDLRDVMQKVLSHDHEVLVASSGSAGQALLSRDRRFDLILCDLMMPELSGMDLHAWLKPLDPALADRIVFVSGGAFTPKAAAYLAPLPNQRLEKPFNLAVLKAMIAEHLNAQAPRA